MNNIVRGCTEGDLYKLTNLVLREWLRSRAQKVSGNKKDLVSRYVGPFARLRQCSLENESQVVHIFLRSADVPGAS